MNRPKNQFLTAPARALFHAGRNAAIKQNLTGESITRAVFDTWETPFDIAENSNKFQDKVKENYDKKLKELSGKIKILEKQNKDPEEIKETLKKEKAKMLQQAFDQALKDLKINKKDGKPVTYLEVVNDPNYGSKIETIYKGYADKADADVSKAVDDYFTQKGIKSGKIKSQLLAIPKATDAIDFESSNPEIQRLQELRAAREQVLDKSKKTRSDLLQNESLRYRATTAEIDKLTSPKGGKIDDYDDGYNPFSEVTDENNPTRHRLNGYLYAQYIFSGGGEQGMQAVNSGIQTPYKLYHSTLGDSRFTMKDLNSSEMGLKSYFEMATPYSNFDKSIGVMAGIFKLIDENIKDPTEHARYTEYVKGKFAELKTGPAANDEQKQLELLFSIKSRAEFMQIDPNWKLAYDKIDQKTVGDKIADYPGTDTTSPTRMQLNGYLYSVYLYSGKNNASVQTEIDKAATIYDNSRSFSHPTKMFTQEHLEGKLDGGFNLGPYLRKAENYSSSDKVKGAIAGLLQQSEAIGNADERTHYQEYLSTKFDLVKKNPDENNQLMMLSSIVSPPESVIQIRESMRIGIIDLMIKTSQQHNQFKFSPGLSADFTSEKTTFSSKEYQAKASQARTEIENFIKTRADADMKDLRDKYKVLLENNSRLNKPLYGPADLDPLRLAIEDSDKKFGEARLINRTTEFRPAVEDKYLEKLTYAEKIYIDRVTDLDSRLKSIKEAGSTAILTNVAPTGGDTNEGGSSGGSSSNEDAPEKPKVEADPYTANWSKAERVTPLLGNYTGKLLANSTDANEKVIGYNYKGDRIATLNNDTEVTRTPKDAEQPARKIENLNFVRVTYKDKKMWIPEEQLFKPEGKDAVESTNQQETEPVISFDTASTGSETSDKFTAAWELGDRVESKFKLEPGSFIAKSPSGDKINLRDFKGDIKFKVESNTILTRTNQDIAEKARRIQGATFIRMTHQGKEVWIAENLLKKVDKVPTGVS